MLEIKNLSLTLENNKILDNVNLTLEDGLFYVITGANGSGKSTLAKIIMGITKPTSGEIFFNGKNITNLEIHERAKLGISLAFQSPAKFKGITVFDLLKLSSGRKIDFQIACQTLSSVGLCANDYINREVDSSLSGGELKRIEIASVLLRDSLFTMLDEPEAGIDLWSFSKLLDVFKELKQKTNSVLIISHQEKLMSIADKIIIMESGKVKSVSSRADAFKILGIKDEKKKLNCVCGGCNG